MVEKMARKIEAEQQVSGGLESTLDLAAVVMVGLGFLFAMAFILLLKFAGVVPAMGALIASFLVWLLLRSLAEIIRILKKSAGLPYGGRISAARQTRVFTCSECGAMLHSESRCDSCGEKITAE